MSKIIFLNLKEQNDYFISNNNNISNIYPFKNPKNLNEKQQVKKTKINKLHNHLINSLKYQSEINAFPSVLPEEINIKFTDLNFWKKLNPFKNKSSAQTDVENNTIYFSTFLLTF